MEKKHKDEFRVLLDHYKVLYNSLEDKKVLKAAILIKIRDHIEVCDHLVTKRRQGILLYIAHNCWDECLDNWNLNTPQGEENIAIPSLELKTVSVKTEKMSTALAKIQKETNPETEKKFDQKLSADDKRFLRSLRIKRDGEEPPK